MQANTWLSTLTQRTFANMKVCKLIESVLARCLTSTAGASGGCLLITAGLCATGSLLGLRELASSARAALSHNHREPELTAAAATPSWVPSCHSPVGCSPRQASLLSHLRSGTQPNATGSGHLCIVTPEFYGTSPWLPPPAHRPLSSSGV